MTKTKYTIVNGIMKNRRNRIRRKKNKKIFLGSILFAISAIILTHSIFVLGSESRNSSRIMEYATVTENMTVICNNSQNEYDIPLNNNNKFYVNENVIVIYKSNGDIDIKPAEYRVESGDNIWNIANDYCDGEIDVRAYIDKIKECNDISQVLQIGDVINMPII